MQCTVVRSIGNLSCRIQNLDIQYTVGLATDAPVTFISVGGGSDDTDFVEELLDTALYMLGSDAPPQVMTTSYGIDEYTISAKLAEYVEPC